jgi:hypothetical protein
MNDATNHREFVAACEAIVAQSSDVSTTDHVLSSLVPVVSDPKPVSFGWYLPSPDIPSAEAFREFSLNAALNGGYFMTGLDGSIKQWASKGSGSMALVELLNALRTQGLMPGVDLHSQADVRSALTQIVAPLPFAAQRMEIFGNFASPNFNHRLLEIMASAETAQGPFYEWKHAQALAALCPAGFGEDPFLKKACLALQMHAGHLNFMGAQAGTELPIPADYQIPRILEWLGAIEVSPAFIAKLHGEKLLDVNSPEVVAMRAAAVVQCAKLASMAGVTDAAVDGVLFTSYRKNPDFMKDSLPPMRCDSLWF